MNSTPANVLPRSAKACPEPLAGSSTDGTPLHGVWLAAGALCLLIGTAGIVLPLAHPRIGPLVRDWRASRAVPLRAKWLATLSMSLSCAWALHALKPAVAWVPAACCALVALYLWTRPTRPGSNPAKA